MGWEKRRSDTFFIHLVSSLFLFLCSYIYISCLRGMFSHRRSWKVTLSGEWRRNHVLFPFSFFGMRGWGLGSGFSWRFCLRKHWLEVTEVCVWSELEMHTRVSKGSKFTVWSDWSRTSLLSTDTHIQMTTLALAPVFLTQKSRVLTGPVSCFTCSRGMDIMQLSHLQKRKNYNLSIHNTVTLKM